MTRRWRPSGDQGSMAFYLVIAIVGLALGALAVPMIVTSSQATRSDTSRTHALDAAQAGVNVALGLIRNAKVDDPDGGAIGTTSKLPCTTVNPLKGNVNGSASRSAYSVRIAYYVDDPVANPLKPAMNCTPNFGTFDPLTGSFAPRFARITSTGTDGPASSGSTPGRTIVSTYTFKTSNAYVVGGAINPNTPPNSAICLDAGNAQYRTHLTLQACTNPIQNQQIFAYRSDLTLQLVSSISTIYPDGLCVDADGPLTYQAPVYLGVCQPLGSPVYHQQWSFTGNGGYRGAKATSATEANTASDNSANLPNLCLFTPQQAIGTEVTLSGCPGVTGPTSSAWRPTPAVGAGGAVAPQLVNFNEFGRCLDIPGSDPNKDHLISYPCTQNPNRSNVPWNQQFSLPAIATGATNGTGSISPSTTYPDRCLTSPGTLNGYAKLTPCITPRPANQTWTAWNGASTSYSEKYTIRDSAGSCLGLRAPYGSEAFSSVDIEKCSGATDQKWNAPPNLQNSSLQSTNECLTRQDGTPDPSCR